MKDAKDLLSIFRHTCIKIRIRLRLIDTGKIAGDILDLTDLDIVIDLFINSHDKSPLLSILPVNYYAGLIMSLGFILSGNHENRNLMFMQKRSCVTN